MDGMEEQKGIDGMQERKRLDKKKEILHRMIYRKGRINPILRLVLVQFVLFFISPWCNSSYSSKSSWCKIASVARN